MSADDMSLRKLPQATTENPFKKGDKVWAFGLYKAYRTKVRAVKGDYCIIRVGCSLEKVRYENLWPR